MRRPDTCGSRATAVRVIRVTNVELRTSEVKPDFSGEYLNAKDPRSNIDRGSGVYHAHKSLRYRYLAQPAGRSSKLSGTALAPPDRACRSAVSARPTTSVGSTFEAAKSATA
jgi:hypothetical protein